MSPNQRIFFALLSFVFSIIPASMMIGASQTAPPVGKTGAPGDGTCAECHTGAATVPGKVVIDFGKLAYTPNQKQTIRIRVYQGRDRMLTGFQMTARLSTNGQAGFFEAGSNTIIQVKDGVQYVSHKGPHVSDRSAFFGEQWRNGDFTFSWTPPGPNAGEVTFYAAAVSGEANGFPEGNVYTSVTKYRAAVNDLPPGYRWQTITVPGATHTQLEAINSSGVILGSSNLGGFLRYPSGQIVQLGLPNARILNGAGGVVGSVGQQAFVLEPNGQRTYFTAPGSVDGMSDGGVLFGSSTEARFLDTLYVLSGNATERYSFSESYNLPHGMTSSGIAYSGHFDTMLVHLRLPDGSFRDASFCEDYVLKSLYSIRISDTGMATGVCGSDVDFIGYRFIAAETGRMLRFPNFWPRGVNNAGQIVMTANGSGVLLTPCAARPVTTNLTVSREGGPVTIGVQSDYPDCRPNAVGEGIAIEPFHAPGSVSFQMPAHTGGSERVTKIWVAGSEVALTQPAPVCTPARLTGGELRGAGGGFDWVTVASPSGCGWALSSTVDWLIPTQPTGTQGMGVLIQALPNTGPPRVGSLVLNGVSYRVVQQGTDACSYQVSPQSVKVPAQGGVMTVDVSAILGCAWTASGGGVSWLRVRERAQGAGGSGTLAIEVEANPYDLERTATIAVAGLPVSITQTGVAAAPVSQGLRFVGVPSCRILDTRPQGGKSGAFGPPMFGPNAVRDVPVTAAGCGVPVNARAYSLQLTVYPAGPLSYVSMYPKGAAQPLVSTLNSFHGRAVMNSAIVPAGEDGAVRLYANGETHATLDINGYFAGATSPEYQWIAADFYPQTPCRLLDTRMTGPLAGEGNHHVPLFRCSVSLTFAEVAQAWNVTAIPIGTLDSLDVFAAREDSRPVKKILAPDGQVTANFAIVGTFYAEPIILRPSQTAHVVIDTSGLFARPFLFGQAGLKFYPLTPCRVADTRVEGGKTGAFGPPQIAAGGVRELPVPQGGCGVPATAKAYALNFTVVPAGPLSYITAWPAGSPQPLVSTLNSYLGQVVANAAIVPAGTNGAIRVFASNATDLVVDISGYFAP